VVLVRESRIDTGSYTQGNKSIDRQMELQDSEEAEDEMKEWPLLRRKRATVTFAALQARPKRGSFLIGLPVQFMLSYYFLTIDPILI
jgi:hypothetical protein